MKRDLRVETLDHDRLFGADQQYIRLFASHFTIP
jgi:hypothetical protein